MYSRDLIEPAPLTSVPSLSGSKHGGLPPPPNIAPPDRHDDRVTAADLGRLVYRNRYTLLVCVLLGLALGITYTIVRQRRYEAMALIEIAPENNPGLSISDSAGAILGGDAAQRLETQIRIIQSDALAISVMRRLRMFAYAKLPASSELNISPISEPGEYGHDGLTEDEREGSLAQFRHALAVRLVPNTELIEVHFRSPDPKVASTAVNTLVSMYIEHAFQSRYNAAMQISEWIARQLDDVKVRAEQSQKELADLQKRSGLIGTSENENTVTDKLRQINEELTNAEADRIVKEAQLRMLANNSPDALASSSGDATLQVLRSHEAQLKLQYAQLSTKFGDGYPPLKELRNEMAETERSINAEMSKLTQKITADYEAAKRTEQMLRGQYDQQKQQAFALDTDAAQYAILQREVQSNRDLYETLQLKLHQAGITAGLSSSNTTVVDYARVPSHPVDPRVPLDIAAGLAGGLFLGIGISFIRASLDTTVRDLEETESITALPAIGFVPRISHRVERDPHVPKELRDPALISLTAPKSTTAEAFRALRSALLLSKPGGEPKVIVVTSSVPAEGKSLVSTNTAIVLAQSGCRTLLVGADLRKPSLNRIFNIPLSQGLTSMLAKTGHVEPQIITSELTPDLDVLASGPQPPFPAEMLASRQMRDLIARWREQYDYIVLDTPPVSMVTDAVVLASMADVVLLVARMGVVTRGALRISRSLLARAQAPLGGVVLNGIDHGTMYYYYGSYAKYGAYGEYGREEEKKGKRAS